MKKILVSILIIILSSQILTAQKNTKDYNSNWKKVYNYELEALPKSALIEVEKIYLKAKRNNNNSTQIIKTLIYKSKFYSILEENAQLRIIENINTELSNSSFPTTNILESILADLYSQYFEKNRWKIINRTKTAIKIDSTDFRTWDLQTLFEEINLHYQNSLLNSLKLQQTGLTQFNSLLILSADSKEFRPTLYDFLAHRAIDFYKNDIRGLTRPSYKFEVTNPELLGSNKLFLSTNISSKDSLSQHLITLKIYKNLTLFHRKSLNPTALIDVTIERLNFVKKNAVFKNKDSIYLNSLQILREEYKEHESSTEIYFNIAELLNVQGNRYTPNSNLEEQFKKQEALKICKVAILNFPNSSGAKKCEILQENILQKNIKITSEKYIPINTLSRLFVEYKNTNNLYFSIFKISHKNQKKFNEIYNDSLRLDFIKNLELTKKWNSTLRNDTDYQYHSTEVLFPKLPHGNYMLFATTENNKLNHEKTFSYNFIQITDFSLIQNKIKGDYLYQVVDRNTGKPIENARVNLKSNRTGSNEKHLNKNFTTDKNGLFSFKSEHTYYNISAIVNYKGESTTFGNIYLRQHYNYETDSNEKHIEIKPFLFTDRSIYRPGQTVHFKAIVLKKQGEKSDILTNEYIEVILEDPNGQEIKQLDLKLNEFGSISGEFILPSGGLTGEYTIYIDESYEYDSKFYDTADFEFSYDSNHTFSVEEYKRPKFETEFNPVTETYKLNDSITVSGSATAFNGSNITNAKVSYRVVRTAIFPRWYYWSSRNFYSSESLEIIHGESITDASGNFEINFKAIPDLKTPVESQPTFNYKIYADITDINGETRSTETIVKVGYHALKAAVTINASIDKSKSTNKISISTKNLNNQFVPTKGNIKIYKLLAPNKPLRNRPWNSPDYQEFTEDEFMRLFPHDPYSDKNDEKSWEKGSLIFEENFDTEIATEIEFGDLKNWISGKYLIELSCKDKFNQKVKDEQRFTVFSPDAKSVADSKLFFINTDKLSYKPTEEVKLQIGSASKDITVTINIEKNHKIVNSYFVHLNNETKTIRIPVYKEDIGGFAIKYHFVNYNSFKNGTKQIIVPYSTDALQIETLTFRDKLQPGSKQTWSFKIKGNKNEKVAAELLASMYDASLDEFKSHDWSFNPIQHQQYYSYGNSTAGISFGTSRSTIRNQQYSNFNYPRKKYDALNWFGFSMNNNRWLNQQYLYKLAVRKQRSTINASSDLSKKKGYIYGTITDDSGPLPGASIIIKGTNQGTQSDFDGNYSIKVAKGQKLVFSFVGYISTDIKVGKNNIINVKLASDAMNLDEVVVTAYGININEAKMVLGYGVSDMEFTPKNESVSYLLAGRVAGVAIRGADSISGMNNPLYIIDGVPVTNFDINSTDIISINVLKNEAATAIYGARAVNGVIIITTKSGQAKIDAELAKVQVRKNLQETAFFFPQLRTDKNGNISFEFTVPEGLTRWKLQLLAHSKDLKTAKKTLTAVTQKELMVIPNPPRFLREGDKIIFSSKISNLTKNTVNGFVQLQLTDALTGKEINSLLGNIAKSQTFKIDAKGNTNVNWTLTIPKNKIQAVQYKVIAKAGDFSDGEQNVLPVLSNRMLVTETLPMYIKSNETKTFTLDKLKNNTSTTLSNHKLTLEVTSNPAWYAVQALPYLMEYPYECSEQTFSRYYANTLASHIANSNPRIQEVFDQWKNSDALLSNLEKNQDLKSLIIQETPWLRDAQSESEQKKRIALLFDLTKMKDEANNTLRKLGQMQFSNGGFPWFKGNEHPNRYITQHIMAGFGHLEILGVESDSKSKKIINKAIRYLDAEIISDYSNLLERAAKIKKEAKTSSEGHKEERDYLKRKHIGHFQLHYLYMRSFYSNVKMNNKLKKAYDYYNQQSQTYWNDFNLYSKGMIALVQFRNNNKITASVILKSLKENSITNEELGMYWKSNTSSWYWHQAPIETQALMIEVFSEIENDIKTIDNLKIWLLKNKQTNRWKTTKATTEAVYALLLQGNNWLEVTDFMDVKIGSLKIDPLTLKDSKIEAGTGYFKTAFNQDEITPEMASVTLSKDTKGIAYGALYWQYFEDLDKITSAETPLKLTKKIFLKKNTDKGEEITEISEDTQLKLGDLVRVRIEIKVDRMMEFVHMKDMRASGLEPINTLSKYKYQDGLGYYESTKDASTNFFFDRLPKGVYVFEYDLRVNNQGDFSNGITTIQCMYAPEFSSHSEGIRVSVK